MSLDEGKKILRADALKEFEAAAKEGSAQLEAAEQQLKDARDSQSAEAQQSAMKHLQETQAAGADKLKQIAARFQEQVAALESLKNQQ